MKTHRSIVTRLWVWIALSLTAVSLSSAARADCNGKWDLSGAWTFTQGGVPITFNLQQTPDNRITGTGSYTQGTAGSGDFFVHIGGTGTVEGTTTGKTFSFRADWNSGEAVGEYSGAVRDDGTISGTTSDQKNPGVHVDWQGDRSANCIVAAARCPSGYVWRDTFDGDTLCVKPEERHRLADGTCSSGYVPRGTFNGDNVCVTPAQRDAAQAQKRRDDLWITNNRSGAAAMGASANPAPAAPAPPPVEMATAIDDVDIYTGPGQEPIIGMLRATTSVPVLGHEPGWYKLKVDVTGGSGWVAEDHLKIGG